MSAHEPENEERQALIGRVVASGRYEILAFLGAGGMGAVYRAMQHPLERLVALKMIHRNLASSRAVLGRFEREMKATASIEHPHTVRVYDYGELDGQPFLTMEYLDGRTLRDVIDQGGPLSLDRVARIGTQIAKALRAVHVGGIVHRDLKPENVMLLDSYGEKDFVKVLDFGIARSLREETGYRTSAGVFVGTPAYMSPEQSSDAPLDPRSDLYTLGVMLYEMAAGRPPFEMTGFTALLHAHASLPPPPLRERAPHVPAALEQVIMGLLEKSPAARPATADELVVALAPFAGATSSQTSPPLAARPGGAPTMPMPADAALGIAKTAPQVDAPPGPPPSNRRTRVLIGAVVGLILGAGAAVKWFGAAESDTRADGGDDRLRGGSAGATLATALSPLLQQHGEPPWPAGCRSPAAAPAGLAEAARNAATNPSSLDAQTRLQTIMTGLGDVPERWLAAARLTPAENVTSLVAAARKATAACPASAVAHNLLGNALQRDRAFTDAAAAYAEAQRLAPDYRAPSFNAALIALRSGDAPKAVALLDQLAAADPAQPNLFLVRAEAQRKAGRAAAALADLREHVRRQPDSADGWLQLGRALTASGGAGASEAFCRARDLGQPEAVAPCKLAPTGLQPSER